MREIPYCFDCWPGGPVTPPPCRRCGSAEDYYTSGLCVRCHTHAPGPQIPDLEAPASCAAVVVDSCPDCLAWGVTRPLRLAVRGLQDVAGEIPARRPVHRAAAGTSLLSPDGSCRLCRKQRSLVAQLHGLRIGHGQPGRGQRARPAAVHRRYLAFAPGRHARRQPYVKKTVPPDMSLLRPVAHRQLVLLDWPRDLRLGCGTGSRRHRTPRWRRRSPSSSATTPPRTAGPRARPRPSSAPSGSCSASRTPPARRSAAATSRCCPGSSTRPPRSPRCSPPPGCWRTTATPPWCAGSAPRPPACPSRCATNWASGWTSCATGRPPRRAVRPRTDDDHPRPAAWALPALRRWAGEGHDSLREISRDDVLAVLPPPGSPGRPLVQGLRSIFRILKARKLVFVNPAIRIQRPAPGQAGPGRGGPGRAARRAGLRATRHGP